MLRRILISGIFFSLFLSLNPPPAKSGAGTKSFQFLKIGTSARPSGMGGAFVAVADDEAALYYNPAGIADFKRPAFITSYVNYLSDIQSGLVGMLKPLADNSVIGGSITYFSYGDFTAYDPLGDTLGSFGSTDFSFNLSYARSVTPRLSIGGTGKFVYEKIENFDGYGIALDLGGLYTLPDGRTKIGAMAQNMGAEINAIGDEKGGLPTIYKLGLSHVLKESGILFSAEAAKPAEDDIFYNFGAEITQVRPLVLRVGWSTLSSDFKTGDKADDWAGIGFGLGLFWGRYKIDYSYSSLAALGGVHRVTLSGFLGGTN